MKRVAFALLCVLLCTACGAERATAPDGFEYGGGPRYAQRFTIDYDAAGRALVTIDDTEQFLVVPEGAEAPQNPGNIPVLQAPLRGVYVAASSAMDFFRCLDALDAVRFTATAPENWSIPAIRSAIDAGDILYAGKYSAPDFELLLSERCTLALESTMIYHSPDIRERLEALGVPVLVERSSYEADPLGRMEWVKLYGLLTGRESEAAAFFDAQAQAVERIRAEETLGKTVAFFAVSPNGYINVRKPGDYVAKMIEFAGGEYALPETGGERYTANLQMEAFYAAARDADILLYDGTIDGGLDTLEQLYAKSTLFRDFAAAQSGNVWCVERNLFQEPTAAGGVVADFHAVFSGAADAQTRLTYLHRLR
ncbi:MAG: ABC transporter substrate-binding protein [Oscillibacter sp.]|nr:ABC transporter substrate-binding protein [Oscillibacter sp.]